MVGIAVGLFIVAVASMLTASQLTANRHLLADTQLQQDLRATADIVTRELRRAGYWKDAHNNAEGPSGNVPPLPTAHPDQIAVTPGAAGAVTYQYNNVTSTFGFKLENHTIKATLSNPGAGYQSLTDEATIEVDKFEIVESRSDDDLTERIPCPRICPTGAPDSCWPELVVRSLTVNITAKSVADPTIERSISSTVRVRNDLLKFSDPTQFCPA